MGHGEQSPKIDRPTFSDNKVDCRAWIRGHAIGPFRDETMNTGH